MAGAMKGENEKPKDERRQAQQESLDDALLAAARNGRTEQAMSVLAAGANPKAKDRTGRTALMAAICARDAVTVRALIPVSDMEAKDGAGDTALLLAVFYGSADMVRLLLDGGASASVVGGRGRTALHRAVLCGQAEKVALLAPKSDLDHADDDGETAEQIAEQEGEEPVLACLRQERARREKAALASVVDDAIGAGPELAPRKPRAL
jgi:uncharacterized protein